MKNKFQVGDRVRVYGVVDGCVHEGTTGCITEVYQSGWLRLKGLLEEGRDNIPGTSLAHPKQCRRLIKSPRRRVWIHRDQLTHQVPFGTFYIDSSNGSTGAIEFIEVRKKV